LVVVKKQINLKGFVNKNLQFERMSQMTKNRNEINFFSHNHETDYLLEEDKYLFKNNKSKYKFNVIGAGMIGKEHIRSTLMEGRATINGIYDTNDYSAEKTLEYFKDYYSLDLKKYESLEEACYESEVDGIIICTPNYTHIEIVKKAIKSGKHIMLEKPMATNIKDAYEITKLANSYNAVFHIGLQYRYKPTYSEAYHEAIKRKSLGDIKMISIMEHRVPFLDKVNQWNKFSEYSGGTLVEKCCHYFDLFNLFAQSTPEQVYATGGTAVNFVDFEYNNKNADIVDNATVIVQYKNGVSASFSLCMFAPMFYEELVLCGDKGRLKTYENENYLPNTSSNTYLEVLRGEQGPSKTSIPSYPTKIQNEGGHLGGTYYEHKVFVDSIEKKDDKAVTAMEGFWSIVIGVAAEESIKKGKHINVGELLENNEIIL